jgi:hypothetical protein
MLSDRPVTMKNSGSSKFPACSMERTTSASGTLFLGRMVSPARNPPNTGCRPSLAVTHALAMASTNATGTGFDSSDWLRLVHQVSAGRTTSSITATKQTVSNSVTGHEKRPDWLVPMSPPVLAYRAEVEFVPHREHEDDDGHLRQ